MRNGLVVDWWSRHPRPIPVPPVAPPVVAPEPPALVSPAPDFSLRVTGYEGQDVTIAVILDLPWLDLRPYAISLSRSGFSGLKVVIVDQSTSVEVKENLSLLGFTMLERIAPAYTSGKWNEWGYSRFHAAAAFLRNNPGFRYAIWTDARDVIFQSNPSTWLENNLAPSQIVVEGLGHTTKSCSTYNDNWVRAMCSDLEWNRIREFETVCTGVFAGNARCMQSLFDALYSGCHSSNHPNTADQGLLNCLVRTAPYDTIVRVPRPREGFSTIDFTRRGDWYQIHPTFGEGTPVMDENGNLCNPETKIPISIVHLYDRMPEWTDIIKRKYS